MDHAATMRRIYEHISAHDIDALETILAEDFVEHEELPGEEPTREGVIAFFRIQVAAFPDLAMVPEDVIDAGDKVVARVRLTGTHTADLPWMPATGRSVDIQVIDIMRFGDDGLVHEHWGLSDEMAMMRQLGVVEGP